MVTFCTATFYILIFLAVPLEFKTYNYKHDIEIEDSWKQIKLQYGNLF